MSDFSKMLNDYRLTTAEILYHMPDHPQLLQTYVWQELDIAPKFPVLNKFLDFWEREIEGKLHSVNVASQELIAPAGFVYCKDELKIH
ncbi:MAG: usg protein [Rickettsiales bacterium]